MESNFNDDKSSPNKNLMAHEADLDCVKCHYWCTRDR